jgi:hypothetical protein
MYYPEANALIPRGIDPRSRTPAFKSAVVTVEPSTVEVSGGNGELTVLKVRGREARRTAMKSC